MHKILVVDDEVRIVDLLQEFLVRMGFEVIKAYGGEEAIRVLRSDVMIDLLVVDMKMPKITGLEVIKEMVNINRKIPAIILTGSIDAEKYLINLKELGYGGVDIVHKPVDLFALLDAVKNRLK